MVDIENLVGRLDNLVAGGTAISSDSVTVNKVDSNSGHHQKKTTNLTSWLQSDYSIFDSQPQTTKVKKETEANDTSKERVIEHFRTKRGSISEKNILAALKSPAMHENKKSISNFTGDLADLAHLASTGGKLQILPSLGNQPIGTAGKKKEKKKDKTKKPTNAFAAGTYDDRGKKSSIVQGKETDRDTVKQSKQKHKSRDGSLKFLTDRTQNVFGEKFSMIVSTALNNNGHSHRRHLNQMPFKREKSISKERRPPL